MKITQEQLSTLTSQVSETIEMKSDVIIDGFDLQELSKALATFLEEKCGVEIIEEDVTGHATICIRAHGATMNVDFEDFATSTIQDDQIAIEIAEKMLALPIGEEYPDNIDSSMPEAYCTYEVLNAYKLRVQVKAMKDLL